MVALGRVGWVLAFGLPALLLALVVTAPAAEVGTAEEFVAAARMEGATYVRARGALERQGPALVPFLREKARAADWRERNLARVLILRIEKPEQVALWNGALSGNAHPFTFRPDRTVEARFVAGANAGAEQVVFTREAVPCLLDFLCEKVERVSSNQSGYFQLWTVAFQVLKHLADPDCVPGVLAYAGRHWNGDPLIVDVLVAVGPPGVPVLREVVRDARTAWPLDDPQGRSLLRREDEWLMRRAAAAAEALGRLADRESAAFILGKLQEAVYGRQIEAFSAALGRFRAPEGVPAVFKHCVRLAELRRHARRGVLADDPHYPLLRQAVLSFGDVARDFLRGRMAPEAPLAERALATGLLWELENPDTAAAFYRAVAEDARTGYDLGPADQTQQRDEVADGRLIFWEGGLYGGPSPPPDALLLERAWFLGLPADLLRLTRCPGLPLAFEVAADGLACNRHLPQERLRLARALAVMVGPRAAPILEKVDGGAALAARAVEPLFRGDAEAAAALLADGSRLVRTVAARVIAFRQDVRALDVLVSEAVAARGDDHRDMRDAIAAIGPAALKGLEARRAAATDWRERLFCEATALRILKPKLVASIEGVSLARLGFESRAGPSPKTYQLAGRRYAEAGGEEAVPLFEAALAFQAGPPGKGAAIFALAAFKQERSIPVVMDAATGPQPYLGRGGDLVAVALQEFGEKGVAAAAQVPADKTDRQDFVTATQTLAAAKDPKGLENILAGLREPTPGKRDDPYAWQYRMKTFLQLAQNYRDPRLLEAVLAVLQNAPKDSREVWPAGVAALAEYDDPRVVPACTRFLGCYEALGGADPAVAALVKRMGEGVGEYLAKALQTHDDEKVRLGAAWALYGLMAGPQAYFGYGPANKELCGKIATATRQAARDVLIAALLDRAPKVQEAAAEGLAAMAVGAEGAKDHGVIGALADWAASQRYPPYRVVEALVASGEPQAVAALLSSYRLSGSRNYQVAQALGKLGGKGVLDSLIQGLERQAAAPEGHRVAEIEALAALGPEGRERIHAFFRQSARLRLRLEAAEALAKHGYREAFPDIAALFQELLAGGPWDPRLGGLGGYGEALVRLSSALLSLDPQAGYPLVSAALPRLEEAEIARTLAHSLARAEQAHPELKALAVPLDAPPPRPTVAEADLPRIRFLECCDLWRRALGNEEKAPEDVRRALLAAGDEALEALVELCYPLPPPSAEAVAAALAGLARDETRGAAVRLLALAQYPAPFLDKPLSEASGAVAAHGAAIRRWRKSGLWVLDQRHRLLPTATRVLEVHWPIVDLRRFALAHLGRLARVEKVAYNWGEKPLAPLLASIRYSPDPHERERLAAFAASAAPGATQVALGVMRNGLKGRASPVAEHWKDLPPHEYHVDWDALRKKSENR